MSLSVASTRQTATRVFVTYKRTRVEDISGGGQSHKLKHVTCGELLVTFRRVSSDKK